MSFLLQFSGIPGKLQQNSCCAFAKLVVQYLYNYKEHAYSLLYKALHSFQIVTRYRIVGRIKIRKPKLSIFMLVLHLMQSILFLLLHLLLRMLQKYKVSLGIYIVWSHQHQRSANRFRFFKT